MVYSYESEDDSDDLDDQEEQEEKVVANDTWGSKKKNFYGRDKKNDVSLFIF